jgi:hypothetical protein
MDAGVLIAGEPAEVVAELERQYDELDGFRRFAGLFQFGGMPHEKAVKNMELYADEVKPEVDKLVEMTPLTPKYFPVLSASNLDCVLVLRADC